MDICSVRTLRKDLKAALDHPSPTIIGDSIHTRAILLPLVITHRWCQPGDKKRLAAAQRQINATLGKLREMLRER